MTLIPKIDAAMTAAYAKAGIPLWVPPSAARDFLRTQDWSDLIAVELCEWFARVWSMAFAAGYGDLKPACIDWASACTLLLKMGYSSSRARELADLLVNGLPGLRAKGASRRALDLPAPVHGRQD
jgi:hypothetical protein